MTSLTMMGRKGSFWPGAEAARRARRKRLLRLYLERLARRRDLAAKTRGTVNDEEDGAEPKAEPEGTEGTGEEPAH